MNNAFNLLQAFKNPQQFMLQMMNDKVAMNNPTLQNAMNMMQNGDTQGVEKLARQICETKGINADEAFANMRKQIGM